MVDGAERFRVMGSQAEVTVLGGRRSLAERARRRLVDLEERWSRFLPDSEIAQLNRSAGRPLVVSPETFEVLTAAVEAWWWSGGHFDPTMGATMDAAGYGRSRSPELAKQPSADPAPDGIPARHLPSATPDGIVLDPYPRSISVPAGVAIDLGGIGKGAAADLVATELLAWGAEGCCVNVGGDLRVAGCPPRAEGWRIDIDLGPGLDRPVVGLIDGAVCTSTRIRRVWSNELGAEHHLRNPADGRPLATGVLTVSIIGAKALQAEVLATTAFAAGPAEANRLIKPTGATGLLVTDDGTVIGFDGLSPFLAPSGATAVAV